MWPYEELAEFWASMDDLDQTPETAAIVNKLVERAITDPRAAPPNRDGVRVIRSRATLFDGKFYPGLQLGYTFDLLDAVTRKRQEVVVLAMIRRYDEAEDADETVFVRGIS